MFTPTSYKDRLSQACDELNWVKEQFGEVAYAVVSALACQRLLLMAAGKWQEPTAGDWDAELEKVARTFSDGGEGADLADFEKRWFGGEAALALVSADTDQVKSYVYESAKIPEVRGASGLLQDLNEKETAEELHERLGIPPEWIIYAGGGSFLIVTPTELADQVAAEITCFYPAKTLTATITAVSQPVSLSDLHSALGEQVRELGFLLKVAKLQRKTIPYFDSLPHGEFCAVCNIRPAQERYGDTPDLLCISCAHKRDHSDKRRMLDKFTEFLNGEPGLRAKYFRGASPETVSWAETLADIGQLGNGYVGAILADGDDIGQLIHSLETLQEFHDFAHGLEKAIEEAVFHSLATHLHCHPLASPRGRWTRFHPFEIIALGGDDLFLIVPASVAFEVGLSIVEEFAQAKSSVLPSDLQHHHWGMSAGFLICPDHFPIYFMRAMTEELLARAKQETRQKLYSRQHIPSEGDQEPESHVDFLILKGAATPRRHVEELLSVLYEPGERGDVRLTERPYPLSRFRELLDLAGQLKGALSRTQVQAMAEALYRGREQATLEILYRLSRLPERPRRVLNRVIQQHLRAGGTLFPWIDHPGARPPYRTTFLDLLELYEFVQPLQGEGGDDDAS